MSSRDPESAPAPLLLRVWHSDGSTEEVVVQRMAIGGGEGDSVRIPCLAPATVVVVPDSAGDHHLEVRRLGVTIEVEQVDVRVNRLKLLPGIRFRLGGARFECITLATRRRQRSGSWPVLVTVVFLAGLCLFVALLTVGAMKILGAGGAEAPPAQAANPVPPEPAAPPEVAEPVPAPRDEPGETGAGLAVEEPMPSGIELLRLEAGLGDAESQFRLATKFYEGDGLFRDYDEAVRWYRKAADLGHGEAMFCLAKCLEHGIGTARNEEEAFALYEAAARAGHAGACFRAGVMSEDGRGTGKDEERAVRRYRQGVEGGSVEAMVNLGLLLAQGRGCEKDEAGAVALYQMAAARNDPDALVLLGMMHEFGIGTGRDAGQAAAHYRRAAEAGDEEAGYYLELLERRHGE